MIVVDCCIGASNLNTCVSWFATNTTDRQKYAMEETEVSIINDRYLLIRIKRPGITIIKHETHAWNCRHFTCSWLQKNTLSRKYSLAVYYMFLLPIHFRRFLFTSSRMLWALCVCRVSLYLWSVCHIYNTSRQTPRQVRTKRLPPLHCLRVLTRFHRLHIVFARSWTQSRTILNVVVDYVTQIIKKYIIQYLSNNRFSTVWYKEIIKHVDYYYVHG